MASDFATQLGDRVQTALERHGPHFWTTSAKGERWLQATCPFHDDHTPSARYQPGTHTFFCHACGKSFTLMEVAAALHIDPPHMKPVVLPAPQPLPVPVQRDSLNLDERVLSAEPEINKNKKYEYRFPDGTLSHFVERIEEGGSKSFRILKPDGSPGTPKSHYPIYQPIAIQPGDYVLVVEGEKCVDAVEKVHDQLDHPIHALTWQGGSGSARKYAMAVAAHLQKLQPHTITLWPDNDEPGYKSMDHIATVLRKVGIRYAVVTPNDLHLELRQDVADYLENGKSLAGALQLVQQEGSPEIAALVEKTLMTADEYLVVERRLYPLRVDRLDMIWHDNFQTLPKRDQARELQSLLAKKARQHPTQVIYRSVADANSFYWRTQPTGRCLRISADGIQMADDPPGWVILIRPEPDPYPAGYTPGVKADFDAWLDQFHLTPTNQALIEAWLCCSFLNLQTPLLLLRGPAGTGKTTLARSILAVVEPSVPEMPVTEAAHRDERGFIRTLGLTRALLLDNVSRLPSGMEDLLSKLVTGANIQLRTLWTENIEGLHYRRSIILTTIGYDIYQSDLSDRTIAMTPQLKTEYEYESAVQMKRNIDAVMDKVRGYIFSQCTRFYQKSASVSYDPHFRVGDLGWVLAVLGHDTEKIARDMRVSRQDLVVQHDAWLDAIIEIVRSHAGEEWIVPTKMLTREMGQRLELNDVSTIGVGRYLQDKEAQFRDYGFTVEAKRGTGGQRMWRFSKL